MKCDYCFQSEQRVTGNITDRSQYNLPKIKTSMRRLKLSHGGSSQVLHGGEILLLPIEDLEALLAENFDLFGRTAIQTNGLRIRDQHIALFKKYKTSLSISLDGPTELNRLRNTGTMDQTDRSSKTIMNNIKILRKEGLRVGIISVISKLHASKENRDLYLSWIEELEELGIDGGRMNLLQSNHDEIRDEYEMSVSEAQEFYLYVAEWLLKRPNLNWAPFREIIDNLLDIGTPNCVYEKCDVFSTHSVLEILADGEIANCSKLNVEGVPFLANLTQEKSTMRYDALRLIDHEHGGCKGCQYWSICHGHCPADGIDGDWRKKSRFCEAWYGLYDFYYQHLKALLPNIKLKVDRTDVENDGPNKLQPFERMRFEEMGPFASSWRSNK